MWFAAPRFFRRCDVVLCRQRLRGVQMTDELSKEAHKPPRTWVGVPQLLDAHHFNELARLTRAHVPLRDALLSLHSHSSSELWQQFTHDVNSTLSFDDLVQSYSEQLQNDLSFHLLRGCVSTGTFIPVALEQAATALRDRQRTKGEIEVAATQARFTMKVLTLSPLALLVALLGLSDSFRKVVFTPGVVVIICLAIALNRMGAMWASHLVARLSRRSAVDEILEVITVLSVHIRAGHSLPSACLHLHEVNSLGHSISVALQKGGSFDDAVQFLMQHSEQFGTTVATVLMSAYRDGQPAVDLIGVLSQEARQVRDQQTQSRIRKLPAQLSAPVVLCALPAFILLVVVPMFLSQINSLSVSLHIPSS